MIQPRRLPPHFPMIWTSHQSALAAHRRVGIAGGYPDATPPPKIAWRRRQFSAEPLPVGGLVAADTIFGVLRP